MRWIGLWLHWATENHLVSLILFKITCLIGLSLFVHTLAGGIYHVKTEVYLHSTSAFLRPSVSICVHLHPMYAHLQQVDGLLDRDVSQCSFPHHSEKRAKKDEDPDRETECLHQIYSASIDRIQREIDRLQIPRRIAVQVDYQYNVSVTYVDEYLLDNFYCIRIQLGRGDLYDVIEFYVHPSTADLANHTSDSNAETFYPSANHTKVNNTKEDDINPSQPKVSIDLLETLWLRNPLLRVYLSEYNTFPTYQSLTFYESSKLDVMMDALHIRCTALPAPYATNCNEYGPITLLPKNDQKSWNQDEREQMQQNKNRSTMNDVRYVHLNTLQDTYTIKQGDVVEQCMKYEDPTQEYSFLRTLLQHQPIQIQTKSDGIRSADQCERQYRQINCVYDLFLNDRGEQIMSNRYRSSSLDIRIKIIKPIIEYRTTKRMAIQLFFIYIGYSLCFWFGLDFVSYVQILRRVVCRLLPNRAQLHRNIIGVLQITFMIIASVAVTLNSWTLVGDYVDRKTFPMSNVYIQRQIEMNAFSVCFDPVQIRTVHSFHNESSCSKFAFDEALKKSIELEPGQERINNISRTPADPRDGIIISDTRKLRQRTSLPLLTKQSVANKRCSNELKSMPLQEMLSRTKPFEKLIDEITIWNDQYNSETLRPPDLKRKLKARQVSISLYTKAGAKCYQLRNDRPQTMNRDLLPFTDGQRLHVQSSHQFYMYMHEWNKKARHRHQYFSGFQTYYLEYNRRLLQHPFRPSCRNYEQSRYESQVHCIEVCVLRFYLLVLHMLPAYITIDLPENNLQSYYPRYKSKRIHKK